MTLYHTIPREFEGDTLKPLTFVESARGAPEGHYIFATDNVQLSACYAIPNGHKHFSNTQEDDSVVLLIQHDTMQMDEALNATMYSVPDDVFSKLPSTSNQYICGSELRRGEIAQQREIKSFDDMMQLGVQIFVPDKQAKTPEDWAELSVQDGEGPTDTLKRLYSAGQVTWLNEARDINPNPTLKAQLGNAPVAGRQKRQAFGRQQS